MAKADLIADAEAKGIPLTGTETVAELEMLLESHGENQAEVEAEAAKDEDIKVEDAEDPDVVEAQHRVAEAQQAVVDAQTALGEAKTAHEAAVVEHTRLTAPPPPVVGGQYLLEGSPVPQDIPADVLAESGQYPRRIMVNGASLEHVSDAPGVDADGKPTVAWVYRKM